jgi:hypothetical protein
MIWTSACWTRLLVAICGGAMTGASARKQPLALGTKSSYIYWTALQKLVFQSLMQMGARHGILYKLTSPVTVAAADGCLSEQPTTAASASLLLNSPFRYC